ncbi:hypothetical protein [Pseudomaricurvus sp.]|uniref:hypothetical protein n=1 Tax=Pseudomaricurvus sp. TaxID=2004510 RepID=UPI003F6D806F
MGNFYCVAFKMNELEAERLALFKGLGFNAIEFIFAPNESLNAEALRYCSSLAQGFNFQHFGIQLQSLPISPSDIMNQALQEIGRKPDSIVFTPVNKSTATDSTGFQKLFWSLTELGYEVLGNDHFVSPESPLASAQKRNHLLRNSLGYNCQNVSDSLGLGPGNASAIGNLRSTNPDALDKYLVHDFDQYTIESTHPHIKQAINQLLCHHQLDLSYFKQRYQLDLAQLLNSLISRMHFDPNHSLFEIKDNILTLTTFGILQLTALCMGLHQQFSQTSFNHQP